MERRMLLMYFLKSPGVVFTCVPYVSCCFSYSSIVHLGPFWSSGHLPKCIAMATRYPHLSWSISEVQENEKNWNDIQIQSFYFILSASALQINKNIVYCFKDGIFFGTLRCFFIKDFILPDNYFNQISCSVNIVWWFYWNISKISLFLLGIKMII